MKLLTTLAILFFSFTAFAQKDIPASEAFEVTGKVKKAMTFRLQDFRGYEAKNIGKVTITNHLGVKKGTMKQLKGILITDLLSKVELAEENPKLLSEFYFVFEATDGYKVVFSWNELFNSEIGKQVYFITEKEGKPIESLEDRIAIVAPKDVQTGRRFVKGLKQIRVERVE